MLVTAITGKIMSRPILSDLRGHRVDKIELNHGDIARLYEAMKKNPNETTNWLGHVLAHTVEKS